MVLLGGSFQHDAEANVGPLTKLGLAQFSVDKCFIGADAISEDKGVSTINLFRAEVARAMAKSAKKMIVLATSDKVGASAVAVQLPPGLGPHCDYGQGSEPGGQVPAGRRGRGGHHCLSARRHLPRG